MAKRSRRVLWLLHNSEILNLTCFAVATGLVVAHAQACVHPLCEICSVSFTLCICSNTEFPALLHILNLQPSGAARSSSWTDAPIHAPPHTGYSRAFEEIHLMHWAKRSFMLSGSPAKERGSKVSKCRQARKRLGCRWRRGWRSSSRVIQTFINPKEITVRLLPRFYWWPYISCSDWWTRGKKLPWQ